MQIQWRQWLVAFCLVAVGAWVPVAVSMAQDVRPGGPETGGDAGDSATDDATDASASSDGGDREADEDRLLPERTIYIPYDRFHKKFESKGRGVYLPYEQFQQLWEKAKAAEEKEDDPTPPAGALITQAVSEAVVEKEVLRVTSKLRVEPLAEGWITLPLQLRQAALESATIGGEPARVSAAPGGGYQLLIDNRDNQAKPFELTLVYARAFEQSPGVNRVTLDAPGAAISRWTIRVPEPGVEVRVSPSIAASKEDFTAEEAARGEAGDDEADAADQPAEDATTLFALVGATPMITIEWTPKAEGAQGLEALATANVAQRTFLEPSVTRVHAEIDYTISRSELSQLTVRVPKDFEVVNVFDANVRRWSPKEEEETDGDGDRDTKLIEVELFTPAKNSQTLLMELERFFEAAGEERAVPVVEPLGVVRRTGVVAVKVAEGLSAEPVTRKGLSQVAAGQAPRGIQSINPDFTYRFVTLPFELSYRVKQIEPRIFVDQLTEFFVAEDKLTAHATAAFDIQRAGVFQVAFDVPLDFEIEQVAGRSVREYSAASVVDFERPDKEESRVVVQLGGKTQGKVGVLLKLSRRLTGEETEEEPFQPYHMTAAVPSPLSDYLEGLTSRVAVYKPEALSVTLSDAGVLRPVSLTGDFWKIGPTSPPPGESFVASLGYSVPKDVRELDLSVRRRQPQLTAAQLLTVRVEPGVVKYTANFRYNIRFSGVKELRIDVPAAIADKLQLETEGVQLERAARGEADDDEDADAEPAADEPPDAEDEADDEDAEDKPVPAESDSQPFRLVRDGEFLGDVLFTLSWADQPEDELAVGKTIEIGVPRITPQGVDRAWGQIVVDKTEAVDVVVAAAEGLRPIDPKLEISPQLRDLMSVDPAMAFEFVADWKLALAVTRFAAQEVARTSVERAVLRMVTTRSGEVRVQALYRLRSALQRLPFSLPELANLKFDAQAARLNGQPVTLENAGENQYLIPLSGMPADEEFVFELRYSYDGGAGHLRIPDLGEEASVEKVYLLAYVPEEQVLLAKRGPWTHELTQDTDGKMQYERIGALPENVEAYHQDVDRRLVQWLTEGVSVIGDPAGTFQTGGDLLVFSALRPATDDGAALRLTTLDYRWLRFWILVAALALAVGLAWQGWQQKLIAAAAVVAAVAMLIVFVPPLSDQLAARAGFLAFGCVVIAVAWLIGPTVGCLKWCGRAAHCMTERKPAPPTSGETAPPAAAPPPDRPDDDEKKPPVIAEEAPAEEPEKTHDGDQTEEGGRHEG